MKIIHLSAENFKRLRAVEIAPNGNLVEIRGKNGAGKSSVLDAIWAAVGGSNVLPSKPIRRGAETAHVKLDLGEILVTRRFTSTGSSVVVETPAGARFRSPQHMLDELVGAIAFDPLEFCRMEPSKQLESLRSLVKLDVDVDELAELNRRDYDERAAANREAKLLRAQAGGIHFPSDLPNEPISVAALTERLRKAGEDNAALERQKANRAAAAGAAARDRERALGYREQAEQLRRQAQEADDTASEIEARATKIEREIFEVPALPEPIDTTKIIAEMDVARTTNMHFDARRRRDSLETDAAFLEMRSEDLTDAIGERSARRAVAIASAEMPIPGLGFGEGEVLFHDLPLDQASQAEKIRVSVAIAMAANPKLRVLCVRDGSLLDADSWRLLSELITSNDYQCWIEVTDDEGKTGVVIEDGGARVIDAEESRHAEGFGDVRLPD